MKAVIIYQYGSLEVLEMKDLEIPVPRGKDLLIEVYACALNPVDYKLREGALKEMMPLTFPHILGGDISGVVKEVGTQVSKFKVGDEVFFANDLTRGGGNAE